ncbi:MAG: hypothetical protein RQ866_08450 [Bacteroidales bacterium]|nr:hypothetical protein [Bacteroidales bacterium]
MKIYNILSVILICILFVTFSSCKKKRETGDIEVTCKPLEGETVDVSTLSIELHSKSNFNAKITSTTSTGSSSMSKGSFEKLQPDVYYVMAWKDFDSNLMISKDDYFGFWPYPINLDKGETKNITIEMYVVE